MFVDPSNSSNRPPDGGLLPTLVSTNMDLLAEGEPISQLSLSSGCS